VAATFGIVYVKEIRGLGFITPRSVRLQERLELNLLTSIEFYLNFRQDLTSNLHFRQWKLPKFETRRNVEVRIARIFVNLRQVIASQSRQGITSSYSNLPLEMHY